MNRRLWTPGNSFVWLSGGALALSTILVVGLLLLIFVNALGFFWPADIARLALEGNVSILGQIVERERVPGSDNQYRIEIKQGNRDVTSADFIWLDESKITQREYPPEAAVLERMEWGNAYGFVKRLVRGEETLAEGSPAVRAQLPILLQAAAERRSSITKLQKEELGRINRQKERLRLDLVKYQGSGTAPPAELIQKNAELNQAYQVIEAQVTELKQAPTEQVVLELASGVERQVQLSDIARIYFPNDLSSIDKLSIYLGKLWEFVSEDPRESNTEGGIFPAIFGTVLMVILMSIVVTPLGVMTAIYLREYAKQGAFVTFVRIAVNNRGGVPSIVFGVFGVGFFIYFVGASIDQHFFADILPTPTFGTGGILWASLTLALLTLPIVIVTAEEGLSSIPSHLREGSYALGATKFETLWRVILPSLTPAILTGVILAVARAAGEVAPLMITGVVKLAPALPLDGEGPFLHLERKFMHLGFHIYDVGFQSPNVDAARPMVYATTMLLLLIVVVLNLTAVILRNKLRRRFASSAV